MTFSGVDSLWLEGPQGAVRELERVPPGRYKVLAIFEQTPVTALAGVAVRAGEKVELTCVKAFAQCKETGRQ